MVKLRGVINFFHDVNPALHNATSIHHKAGVLMRATYVFHSANLTLFMVASEK